MAYIIHSKLNHDVERYKNDVAWLLQHERRESDLVTFKKKYSKYFTDCDPKHPSLENGLEECLKEHNSCFPERRRHILAEAGCSLMGIIDDSFFAKYHIWNALSLFEDTIMLYDLVLLELIEQRIWLYNRECEEIAKSLWEKALQKYTEYLSASSGSKSTDYKEGSCGKND